MDKNCPISTNFGGGWVGEFPRKLRDDPKIVKCVSPIRQADVFLCLKVGTKFKASWYTVIKSVLNFLQLISRANYLAI